MKNIILSTILLFFCFNTEAQLLNDEEGKKQVEVIIDKLYNDQKAEAKTEILKLRPKYGNHPIFPTLSSMLMIGAVKTDKEAERYLGLLDLAVEYAEKMMEKDEEDIEAMFFAMTAHSYKALYYSEQHSYLKAVGEAQRTYRYIKKAYDLTDEFPEFLLSVGLYNYYRVQYPETHPAVKPLVGIFKDGDKALGLKQLEKCAEVNTFTRPEALSYITHIYLKYENEYRKGLKYAEIAYESYPNNIYFKSRYAEALIRNKKYEKGLPYIEDLINSNDSLYKAIGLCFKGYYYEFGEKNDKMAAKCYAEALVIYDNDDSMERDYACWAHIGIARILVRNGEENKAKGLYNLAKDGEYESIRKEAKAYLKEH